MLVRQQQAVEQAQHEQQLAAALQRQADQQDAAAGGELTAADIQAAVQVQHAGSETWGQMDMQEAKAAVKVRCSASIRPLFSAQHDCQTRASCTILAAPACLAEPHKKVHARQLT